MNLKCILPLAASLLLLAFPGKAQQSCYDVVPLPQKIELQDNQEPFLLSENTEIAWKAGASDADGMKRNAAFLAGYIEKCLGFAPETVGAADGDILLVCDPSCKLPKEGYRAEVTADGIVITGSSPAGVFYGIQMPSRLNRRFEYNYAIFIAFFFNLDIPFYWRHHLRICNNRHKYANYSNQ